MVRPVLTDKKRKVVKCDNCDKVFYTTKTKNIQCGDCGNRFELKGNEIKS